MGTGVRPRARHRMSTTATLLQFAAEVSLFLVAVAGLVLAVRRDLLGRDRTARGLLIGGFLVLAVSAFAQGTLTVDQAGRTGPAARAPALRRGVARARCARLVRRPVEPRVARRRSGRGGGRRGGGSPRRHGHRRRGAARLGVRPRRVAGDRRAAVDLRPHRHERRRTAPDGRPRRVARGVGRAHPERRGRGAAALRQPHRRGGRRRHRLRRGGAGDRSPGRGGAGRGRTGRRPPGLRCRHFGGAAGAGPHEHRRRPGGADRRAAPRLRGSRRVRQPGRCAGGRVTVGSRRSHPARARR